MAPKLGESWSFTSAFEFDDADHTDYVTGPDAKDGPLTSKPVYTVQPPVEPTESKGELPILDFVN